MYELVDEKLLKTQKMPKKLDQWQKGPHLQHGNNFRQLGTRREHTWANDQEIKIKL